MRKIEKDDLLRWYELLSNEQIATKSIGFESDYQELIRLNHLVMETAHDIHNENMLMGRGKA